MPTFGRGRRGMSQSRFSFYDGLVSFFAITLWPYVPDEDK